jgi:3-oxoacyl-[acyl-carrier-protein] synthase-1
MMTNVVLNELGMLCALGDGKAAVLEALRTGRSAGLRQDTRYSKEPLFTGQVDSALPSVGHLADRFHSRNNQLLLAALNQIRPAVDKAIATFGSHRVAVVLGTSTSGIAEAEQRGPGFHYGQMEIGGPSEFLSTELGLTGPAYTLSTACSSSAKALISAQRLLNAGICDAVLCGGVDTLCRFTNAGFMALEAVSRSRCRPFEADRDGINIGEAAALFLATREGAGPRLLGGGESSDAHHISAPQPEGLGAATAMRAALDAAGLKPEQVSALNAHGTATPQNDAMETLAIEAVLGPGADFRSTKSLSGHTLGAAGALEAAFCWLLLSEEKPVLMSNSFGFGGSNASLILGLR